MATGNGNARNDEIASFQRELNAARAKLHEIEERTPHPSEMLLSPGAYAGFCAAAMFWIFGPFLPELPA